MSASRPTRHQRRPAAPRPESYLSATPGSGRRPSARDRPNRVRPSHARTYASHAFPRRRATWPLQPTRNSEPDHRRLAAPRPAVSMARRGPAQPVAAAARASRCGRYSHTRADVFGVTSPAAGSAGASFCGQSPVAARSKAWLSAAPTLACLGRLRACRSQGRSYAPRPAHAPRHRVARRRAAPSGTGRPRQEGGCRTPRRSRPAR